MLLSYNIYAIMFKGISDNFTIKRFIYKTFIILIYFFNTSKYIIIYEYILTFDVRNHRK